MEYKRRDTVTPDVVVHFSKAVRLFELMAAAAEVAVGGETLLLKLESSTGRADGYAGSQDTQRLLSAFAASRRRLKYRAHLADVSSFEDTGGFDRNLARALNRVSAGASERGTRFRTTLSRTRSVNDVLQQADLVQRRFDDLVAQAPGSGDGNIILPGDGSDGGTSGGTDSGGEGGHEAPPTDPLEEYSEADRQQARDDYDERIDPPAAMSAQTTSDEVRQIFESSGQGPAEWQRRVNEATDRFTAGLTAIVVGAVASIGGPGGAILATLAGLLLQPYFKEIGELIREAWDKATQES